MGVAAYQRGSQVIRRSLVAEQRPVIFEQMDRLNALQKYDDCGQSLGPLAIKYDTTHKVWWALDAQKLWSGYGYHYKTFEELMCRWSITLTSYDAITDTWGAVPRSSGQDVFRATKELILCRC